jgi:hypothetical protein
VYFELIEEGYGKTPDMLLNFFLGIVKHTILELPPDPIIKPMQVGWFHKKQYQLMRQVVNKPH